MKLYFIFSILCVVAFDFPTRVEAAHDFFSAVTVFPELGQLYFQAKISRTKEPNFESDTTLSAETKNDICLSITTSGFAALHGLKPVNMDTIYDELRSFVEGYPHVAAYHKDVMEDYQEAIPPQMRNFTFKSRQRFFNIGPRTREPELSFACVAKERSTNEFVILYISEAYNINRAVLDVPTEEQILARFVCKATFVICELVAIAEEPAVAIPSSLRPIEKAYLQYRKVNNYKVADKASEDPLCQLSKSEKLRICASVMGSLHFANRIKFIPDEANVSEQCTLKTVSFKTDEAVAETKNDPWYNEWMVSCFVQPIAPNEAPGHSTIFISRAYLSQYVFVYALDLSAKAFYIDNVSAHVGSMVDKETLIGDKNEVVSSIYSSPISTDTITNVPQAMEEDPLINPNRIFQSEISVQG